MSNSTNDNKKSSKVDLIRFKNSFGYDCNRLFNLCIIDDKTLVFTSGNVIHFFNIFERSTNTRLSNNGCGIGYITKNPNSKYNYLTIAENGRDTPIYIYEYPNMNVIATCKHGTAHCYVFVNYSYDGELMVSQGGAPDYSIVVWRWKDECIQVKCKNQFDGLAVMVAFSEFNDTQLVSAGAGHIKFWNICQTSTGLRLECQRGCFEKRNASDIFTVQMLPNGRVLSGCNCGNILLWQDGHIKYEVRQKNGQACHGGSITQIILENKYVWTIGRDGYVRIWLWELFEIGHTYEVNENVYVEINPLYECTIGNKEHLCDLLWAVRSSSSKNLWYAQDGNGGIWSFQVDPDLQKHSSTLLLWCHADGVVSAATSPVSSHIATLGTRGSLHIHNYVTGNLLERQVFPADGKYLIWLSTTIGTGNIIIMGFGDGVIRMILVNLNETTNFATKIATIQKIKYHKSSITKLSTNPRESYLVSGSMDNTLFIYRIVQSEATITLLPVGYIETPSAISAIAWKLTQFVILLGCHCGHVLEIKFPDVFERQTQNSYLLSNMQVKHFYFLSIKSKVFRQIHKLNLEKKKENIVIKSENIIEISQKTSGVQIDFSDEMEEPLSNDILNVPSPVLWLQYSNSETSFFSMGSFDSGFLYEYNLNQNSSSCYIYLQSVNDHRVNSYIKLHPDLTYALLGISNGELQLYQLQKHDFLFTAQIQSTLRIHDNQNGLINSLCQSYDYQYIFSVGSDGNISMYEWAILTNVEEAIQIPIQFELLVQQRKQNEICKKHQTRIGGTILDKKEKLRDFCVIFANLKKRNEKLPPSIQISTTDWNFDERITEHLRNEKVDYAEQLKHTIKFDVQRAKLQLQKLREYFFKVSGDTLHVVSGIRMDVEVGTFVFCKVSKEFDCIVQELEKMSLCKHRTIRSLINQESSEQQSNDNVCMEQVIFVENFLRKIENCNVGLQMRRLLKSYQLGIDMAEGYRKNLKYMMTIKPHFDKDFTPKFDPLEIRRLIGNLTLKIDLENFSVENDDNYGTTNAILEEFNKYFFELIRIRKGFNNEIISLKKAKFTLAKQVKELICEFENYIRIQNSNHTSVALPSGCKHLIEFLENKDAFETIMKEIIYDAATVSSKISSNINVFTQHDDIRLTTLIQNLIYNHSDQENETCPWRSQMAETFFIKVAFRSKRILEEIHSSIEEFDIQMWKLKKFKLNVELKAKLLECHLLSMNQEVWIIKDCQFVEQHILNNINATIGEINKIKMEIFSLESDTVARRANVEQLENMIDSIEKKFVEECTKDKRFAVFLRKIFRKKEKDVNENDDEQNYEILTSGPDSSEDDDLLNISISQSPENSRTLLFANVCPQDCDPTVFELTYSLRAKRILHEQILKSEKESLNETEFRIQQEEAVNKKLEIKLKQEYETKKQLALFRREKMNDVESLLILKTDQLKHLTDLENINSVKNGILVTKEAIEKLEGRVVEIEVEILVEKKKLRGQYILLQGLDREFRILTDEVAELKLLTYQKMMDKFGMVVDIDEMHRTLLESLFYKMTVDDVAIQKDFQKRNTLVKAITEKEKTLLDVQRINSEKLNILTILQSEITAISTEINPKYQENVDIKLLNDEIGILEDFLVFELCSMSTVHTNSFQQNGAVVKCVQPHIRREQMIVQNFLEKFCPFGKPHNFEILVDQISKYLISSSVNYNTYCDAEELINIIKKLEELLSNSMFRHMGRYTLLTLFNNVRSICESEHKELDFSFGTLIDTIVLDVIQAVPKEIINYEDMFLLDFLLLLFEFYDLNSLLTADHINVIAVALYKIQRFYAMRVSIKNVLKHLQSYDTNVNNELVTKFIDQIIKQIMCNYELSNDVAKAINFVKP